MSELLKILQRMKQLTFLTVLFICFISKAQVNLDSGLVAFYPFEGNANDLSNNAINASAFGETYTIGVYGSANSAIVFDGSSSSYVDAGNDNRGISDTIAISCFVRTTFNGIGDIVSKYDPSNDRGYHFQISLGKIRLAGRDTGGGYRSTGFSFTAINDSAWHHILGVVRGNTWILYVDCVAEGAQSNATINPDISSNAELGIGKDVFSDQKFLGCEVDEVRIYNRELTVDERDSLCATAVFASVETIEHSIPHFQIYPNPANTSFAIAADVDLAGAKVLIYDLSGKIVHNQTAQNHIPIVDISMIEPGNYIVQVLMNDRVASEMIVIY